MREKKKKAHIIFISLEPAFRSIGWQKKAIIGNIVSTNIPLTTNK